MNDIAYHVCPDYKKKKKRLTYRPSQSSGQKGKQISFFLGLMFFSKYTQYPIIYQINQGYQASFQ